MTRQPISRHAWDHTPGGQDEIQGTPWIYIGTVGVDNADDQLNGNPPPFNPSLEGTNDPNFVNPPWTPGDVTIPYVPIPFQNSWTNAAGGFSPVCFMVTMENYLEIHGAFTGGTDNSVVFTLPDLSSLTPTPPQLGVSPPQYASYWTPTPHDYGAGPFPPPVGAAAFLPGTYWPTAPKALVGAFADGSGAFTFLIGIDGTVTYVAGV